MSVLQPYIDSGKLVVKSKQMGMDKVGTLRWDGATAQARMDNLLSAIYTDEAASMPCCRPMTACRSASSRRSRASATAPANSRCRSSPARTPKCPRSSRSSRGEQYSTVFKDTRDLAKVTVDMVDAVAERQDRRSTTPRPTTTASRSFRPICSSRLWSTRPTGEDPGRLRLLQEGPDQLRQATRRGSDSDRCRRCKSVIGSPSRGPMASCSGKPNDDTILEMRGITKTFPGVKALTTSISRSGRARSTPSSARTAPASRR